MASFSHMLNEHVRIELKGKQILNGKLAFVGTDIVVLYSLKNYYYICMEHIYLIDKQQLDSFVIEVYNSNDRKTLADTILDSLNHAEFTGDYSELKAGIELLKNEGNSFTIKEAITNAKNRWISLFLSPTIQIVGKVSEVKDDYFSFYSPTLKKEVFIATKHLHFFTVLKAEEKLFGLEEDTFIPTVPTNQVIPNTFSSFIATFVDTFLIINNNKAVYVNSSNDSFIESRTAEGNKKYYGIEHIKTIQVP
ncbi:MAG: hypothetical protein ACI35O_08035 [Bacillaceae bacterium]